MLLDQSFEIDKNDKFDEISEISMVSWQMT